MSMLKIAAAAAAILGGTLAYAEAQPYGQWNHGHQGYYYRQPAPVYVHPRILRKQAQMQQRIIQKYGYVQPHYGYNPGWGRGYHHPHRPRGPYHYGW